MDYLLKASAILIIFYVCYQLFLQRETFFQANRWFLLSGLLLACCIPLVVIPIYIEYTPSETSYLITANNSGSIPTIIQEESFDFTSLIIWTYIAGVFFFFGKLLIELLSLRSILNKSILTSSGRFKIMETNEHVAPFSFFNHIVYNPNQFKEVELTHVITHEKVHTQELHSIDSIFAQVSCILFWFNPIVWLYKKALQQNLEFIADQKAQYISECDKSYQTVLLKASVKNHQLAFTNNFYTSLIKKRIIMLHKSKSNKLNQLKLILALPILAAFVMSFNTENVYIETPSETTIDKAIVTEQTSVIEIVISKDTTDDQLKSIQTKLKSKGITFTYSNINRNKKGEITSINTDFKSDQQASNYNISGVDGIKAFRFKSSGDSFSVGTIDSNSNTFVYKTKDGNASVQSTGHTVYVIEEEENNGSDSTKFKVIRNKSIDTFYVKTRKDKATWISKDGSETNFIHSENVKANILINKVDEPIFIIDGKVVEKSLFEDVDSDDIKSINILKGKSALESYGDKGKNGVVIMTIKDGNIISKNTADNNSLFFNVDGNDKPLYVLNGKVIDKKDLDQLNPNRIDNIEILKDDKAVKAYGDKGKNGVVIINSKKSNIFSTDSNVLIEVEVEENSPWEIRSEVSRVYFKDDKGNITAELVISKNSTDAFIEQQKKALKKYGIDAKISKVRRNKAGEITSIKIALDDNKGHKSSASWKEKEQAIPDIVMGKSNDDTLFVRAIGN